MSNTEWLKELDGYSQLETALNIRWLLILLELPGTYNIKKVSFLIFALNKFENSRKDAINLLFDWLCNYPKEQLRRLVINFNSTFTYLVFSLVRNSLMSEKEMRTL